MNIKMKESKNLKVLKSSNILVGFYLDEIKHEGQISNFFYSLANQKKQVDVVLFDGGLNDKELELILKLAKKPIVKRNFVDENGASSEELLESEKALNLSIYKIDVSNFSKIFNSIFNYAIENEYEAFSVVEYEDTIEHFWYDIANKYMFENDEISIFLPLMRNYNNGNFLGMLNEASWVEGFSDEPGKFDSNLLMRLNCANPLGGLYKTSSLQEFSEENNGKFYVMKESIKLTNYYEFFLRMIYNDVKMMSIPRIGYNFIANNIDIYKASTTKIPNNLALIPIEKGGMDQKEIRFWLDLAKKEYFFDEDRNIKYEQ